MRKTVVALATFGVVLSGAGIANAAPGDCRATGPVVMVMPDGREVRSLECEPYPVDPDALPPLYSVCEDLEPAGELPRRTCQSFLREDDEPVGDPQSYVYPPDKGSDYVPEVRPYTPRPYVAPAGNDPSNDTTPLTPAPRPEPVAPRVDSTPDAPPAPVEEPVVAAPAPSPVHPAADRETWVDTVDRWVPWAGAGALVVLVLALVWRPRSR